MALYIIFYMQTVFSRLGGAMVLGKLPAPGRPTIRMTVGQGPIVLAVGKDLLCSQ